MNQTTPQSETPEIYSEDKVARDIMILAKNYPMISMEATIKEAVSDLMDSYDGYIANKRLIYTVHRSMLVMDEKGEFSGILSVRNLIQALTPNDDHTIEHNQEFWSRSKDLARRKVKDVMQHSVAKVNEHAKLTEVAQVMAKYNTRRVVVVDDDNEVIGIVREQELFFEIANIIL